jgi:hypothetical protein
MITSLQMAGMGMGGGGATKSKKKKGGKAKSKGLGGGNGGAAKSFDVSKSLLKAEKLYDELAKESAKIAEDADIEFIHAEYMVAARISPKSMKESAGNIPGAASVSDWVPVAQLCLKRHVDDPNFDSHVRDCQRLQTAVSYYCREISYAATLGASIFKSIPRNAMEYSIEPIDSFHKFVYEDIIEGKNENDKNENTMTKVAARSILELEEGCNDAGEIKRAYRKLSFKLHPDRFVSKGRSEEEINQASADFAKVKIAYESLSSGVRETGGGRNRSWYESLGGRSRTDFSGKLNLLPMADARSKFEKEDYKSAIACLNTDTVMTFVTRNQAAAASANSGGN